MIHRIDERLRDEVARFALRFACCDCVEFDPDGDRCSLGYPVEPHRDPDLAHRDEVTFCKTFELA